MKRILHVTTVHPRRDTRIFYRECLSLSKNGYKTYLIVADGLGDETYQSINILDIGKTQGRIKNFFKTYFLILKKVKELKPDLVHFHDAELMFVGSRIAKTRIPVYYDIHENIAKQILDKKHISVLLRRPLHYLYRLVERVLINNFHLVLAEKSYAPVYLKKGKSTTIILNLPEISSFESFKVDKRTENGIFYIGGISNDRGFDVTIKALRILKTRGVEFFMHYVGPKPEKLLRIKDINEITSNIKFYGRMDLIDGYEISRRCKVGLAVLKPIKNYIGSYPTKMFEYMSIKLPVITSNFSLYEDIVVKNDCGFCVNPFSEIELADKLEILLKDDDKVKFFGNNGYQAVRDKFNWSHEEIKLLRSYNFCLNE